MFKLGRTTYVYAWPDHICLSLAGPHILSLAGPYMFQLYLFTEKCTYLAVIAVGGGRLDLLQSTYCVMSSSVFFKCSFLFPDNSCFSHDIELPEILLQACGQFTVDVY